jgi:hypothetical protein
MRPDWQGGGGLSASAVVVGRRNRVIAVWRNDESREIRGRFAAAKQKTLC